MNNLADMVKDITYFYIKYYYEKELAETKQSKLSENEYRYLLSPRGLHHKRAKVDGPKCRGRVLS